MKMLVITSGFPRHDEDLAGHFVQSWCESLVGLGHEVDVLAWRGPGVEERRLPRGLSVRYVGYGPPGWETLFYGAGAPENLSESPARALLGLPAGLAMIEAGLRACRHREYDVVVGHWLVPGGILARVVGTMTGIRSAVVGHSGGVHLLHNLPYSMGKLLARMILSGATTVPSAALREKLLVLDEDAVVDIAPMGFETVSGPLAEPKSRGESDVFRLGFLGRLVPIKGLPVVLEAVERLRRAGLSVELEVVGDGPCRRRWESRAGGGVHFLGSRFGEEKGSFLRSWHALVMPSRVEESGRHEGLPVSLLEAASVGTVPLVSGVPGVEKWLARPCSQIIRGGAQAWYEAIKGLMSLPEREWESLVEESARSVQELSWAIYGGWWERWLMAKLRGYSR